MDPIPSTETGAEWLGKPIVITPYERRNETKETPYQFSGEETDNWVALRDGAKERNIPLTKVFDKIAEQERINSGNNDWQTSRQILDYYLSRDTYEECGQVGSLELHNALLQAQARYLLINAPIEEKFKVVANLAGDQFTKYKEAFSPRK